MMESNRSEMLVETGWLLTLISLQMLTAGQGAGEQQARPAI